jgi:ABC-type dipeptide/oligopeptide/nickel transport system ATPase component
MYDIILGRSKGDQKKYGKKGTVYIGKQYIQMGSESSLSNPIYMDVARAHAMLIVGKRGGGKSYTMGSIAEGLADMDPEVAKNLSFVLMDTMGVYWSMKYANEKEEDLLKKWGLHGKGLDVQIYVPGGFFEKYKADGIPVDFPLYIQPRELSIEDWMAVFHLTSSDFIGVVIQKIVGDLLKTNDNFDIDDIINKINSYERIDDKEKLAATMRFENTKNWGIFSKNATKIKELLHGGKVTVIDYSAFVALPGGWEVKALVLGLISKKIFIERMMVRKNEEKQQIAAKTQLIQELPDIDDIPMPWIIVDEAHEFLPRGADDEVPSSKALITILREGRQPGVSLILATQQPAKIHTDAITQSDIVLAHRITASFDLEALDKIFLSYDSKGSKALFNSMPRTKGCAIIMDDKNERLHTMQVKPRISWHGGEDPNAIREIEDEFDF